MENINDIKEKAGIKPEVAGKCEVCKKRKTETVAMYNGVIANVCISCYEDILDEED